ncbi:MULTISPECIES: NAD-dependent epimerase/dehydratase family protein [Aequorivita]|uniref:NAD-dependent epimerase/dehydratase family protein n=1 Tax=Aequorivita iocasae TaxID=2803865 RepID=A0ABX7DSF8_9FLAO|nr:MULTISPECIES: NAD-dependent epimerase/dehydratase family protein [Aequorivita]QQX77091.1 NAD-dependent epimerase/dehydratase family protein [Aequorivita iocasae]UCA56573.1 NAD-dependent epimerase/dehydratase family protein [Aequorivita sp. F7]
MKTVGIIGGSGFIGSYITKKFLEEGYSVKVSVTDIKKSEKYQHLFNLENSDNLNISALKVEDLETLKDFISDCEVVIHGGTPFQLDVKDPQTELFDPTLTGTENFLEAIQQAPMIEKVIFIASVAAYNTNFPLPAEGKKPTDTFSEKDTPFMSEESHPYAQAKFIANQTVEKFIQENPRLSFEIISVSPVGVMGKSLSNREDSTSTGLQFLFKNKIAPNPFVQMLYDTNAEMAVVDVNDVAEAVFKASTTTGLHGKNYLLSSESYPVSDMSLMLNHQAPKNKGSVIYKNTLAMNDLGIKFRPVQETLNNYSQ